MHTTPDRTRKDGGFTLIELMVVVLVIGILLAIAIPTFLGARTRAQDSAAKSALRNSLTAAGVIFTDTQSYTTANAAGLTATEGSITYVDSPTVSANSRQVSALATASTSTAWAAASRSASGTCWLIKVTNAGAVTYGSVTATASNCTGATADTGATAATW